MDVICEQCKAEYEFDDALVGERGTTVKCSRCGHVFRVHARGAAEGPRATLQLRFSRDGRVQPLGSLRELQQRIANGEVGREDELGREGYPFRRLSDVPELKNFFPGASAPASSFPTAPPAGFPGSAAPPAGFPGSAAPPAGFPGSAAPPAGFPGSAAPPAGFPGSAAPPPSGSFAEPPTGVIAGRPAPRAGQRTVLGIGPGAQAGGGAATPHFGVPLPRGGAPADGDAPTLPSSGAPTGMRNPPSSLPPPSARLAGQATSRAPTGAPAAPFPAPRTPAQAPSFRPPQPQRLEAPSYAPMTAAPTRPADEPPRAPISGVPTRPAAEPPVRGLALDTAEAFDERPDAPITSAAPRREPREPLPAGRAGLATEQRLERPGALAEAMGQRPSGGANAAQGAGAAPAVRLRVGEDEAPAERATGGSKLPYIAGAAVLLAAAGWGAVAYLGVAPERSEPISTPAPTPATPDAAAATEAVPADAGAAPSSAAGATPVPSSAPSAAADKPAPATKPADDKAAKPEPGSAGKAADKPDKAASREPSGAGAPKDYGGLVSRGDQLFAKGDLEGAREAFTSAIAQRASGSEANSGLGFVLMAMGQTREALPYLGRAAASGYAEASIGLGDAHRKLGNKEDAVEAYGTYLARMPNGARAKYARAQLDALGGGGASGERPSGGAGSAAAAPRDTEEPQNAPSSDYRPAGEVEGAPTDEPSP